MDRAVHRRGARSWSRDGRAASTAVVAAGAANSERASGLESGAATIAAGGATAGAATTAGALGSKR